MRINYLPIKTDAHRRGSGIERGKEYDIWTSWGFVLKDPPPPGVLP